MTCPFLPMTPFPFMHLYAPLTLRSSTQCTQESHRVFPVNMDVLSWLGAYHVKNEVYEKSIPYFDLASRIQPQEVKWALMVASCYRRIGALPQALGK